MLPGMSCAILGSAAASGGGGGTGGAPNPVSWDDLTATLGIASTEEETMSGFAGTLPLRMTFGTVFTVQDVRSRAYAVVDGGSIGGDPIETGAMIDFNVTPGAGLAFSFAVFQDGESGFYGLWGLSTTVTIAYKSAGSPTFDSILDTFDIALGPSPP